MNSEPDTQRKKRPPYAAHRWLAEVAAAELTDACVPWPFRLTETGYGRLYWGGKQRMASHVVLELSGRPRPTGEGYHGAVARHRCDQPACCNPQHLEWGTQGDNVADMANRRRAARGERAGGSKLTEAKVREIRELAAVGWSQRKLAARYGVSAPAIGYIVRRLTWAHVPDETGPPPVKTPAKPMPRHGWLAPPTLEA